MPLAEGSQLGPYSILGPLGAGGMGEVYRARDPRLGREVAIKILPKTATGDPDRLRRFEQEAKAAGSLSHPNILTVFDVGEQEGAPYLVTELLPGESLRQRMSAGLLPVRRVVDFAAQIARGLAAAHDAGIVHRDLKPENVFVTRDGNVRILDFGLAKLRAPSPSGSGDSPTVALGSDTTEPGTLLGTVGYMSPEQVRGQPVDGRSDLFSFGAILHEMLTGQRVFRGESSADVLSAILREEPPEVARAGESIPPALSPIVRRCLEKNPLDRFQSARDLAFQLELVSSVSSSVVSGGRALEPPARRFPLRAVAFAALLLVVGAILGRVVFGGRAESTPRFLRATFRSGTIGEGRFSPDGQTIVFDASWNGAGRDVYSARIGSPEARPFGWKEVSVAAVSSAGELALVEPGRVLSRVPLEGGSPRAVVENVLSADWSPDGKELAALVVSKDGAELQYPVGSTIANGEEAGYRKLRISSDGTSVAVACWKRGDAGLRLVRKGEGERPLCRGFSEIDGLAFSPDGTEVWFSASQPDGSRGIHAVPTDGGETRILLSLPDHTSLLDVDRNGRLLVAQSLESSGITWVGDREEAPRELGWLDGSRLIDLSEDGRTLLFDELGAGGGADKGIYLRRADGSPAVRLGEGYAASLSPDGRLALGLRLGRERPSERVILPTGAGTARKLPNGPIEGQNLGTFLPDGRTIVFSGLAKGARRSRAWVQDLDGGDPRPITAEGVRLDIGSDAVVTPDGAWVLGRRDDGTMALFPVAGGEPRAIPDLGPHAEPVRWLQGGKELAVLVAEPGRPERLERVELPSGRRHFLREIVPPDPTGFVGTSGVQMSADGRIVAYSYRRRLSTLYVVEGVR